MESFPDRLALAKALFAGEGAELGVAGGSYSDEILQHCPAVTLLWSIDRWSDHHNVLEYWSAANRLARFGASVEGSQVPGVKTLQFSGYEWRLRQAVGNPGGSRNVYDPANAWTDNNGFLHLRIAGQPNHWTSAEATLTRSLGYGSYRFVVRDVSRFEPAVALSMSSWDDTGPAREMNIEISRWGEPTSKNAQYVIQPYYVPANTVRFTAPAGTLTYTLRWEPGRASFKTVRGASGGASAVVSEHVFTSGVPSPGNETFRINLYVFYNKKYPLQHESEVIVEKFEYLP